MGRGSESGEHTSIELRGRLESVKKWHFTLGKQDPVKRIPNMCRKFFRRITNLCNGLHNFFIEFPACHL